jgi:hypothetical protein
MIIKPGMASTPALTAGELAQLGPSALSRFEEPEFDDEEQPELKRSSTDPGASGGKKRGGIFAKLKGDYSRDRSRSRMAEREAMSRSMTEFE